MLVGAALGLSALAAWLALSDDGSRGAAIELGAKRPSSAPVEEDLEAAQPEPRARQAILAAASDDSAPAAASTPDVEGLAPFSTARESTVFGRVIGSGGTALPGAEVELDGEREQETDPAGRFQFEGVEPGEHMLLARHEERRARVAVMLSPASPGEEIVIELLQTGRLEGVVIGADGSPQPGGELLVIEMGDLAGGEDPGGARYETKCDEDGRFVIEEVNPGRYLVVCSAGSFEKPDSQDYFAGIQTLEAEVRSGETTSVELRSAARSPVEVYGTVTCAGEPVENAFFLVLGDRCRFGERTHSVETGPLGDYRVELEDAGDWVFAVGESLFGKTLHPTVVRVPRVERLRHDFVLDPLMLAGIVRDPGGKAVSECVVLAIPDLGLGMLEIPGESQSVGTESDGSFAIAVLEEGDYTLYFMPDTSSPDLAVGRVRVTIRAGESPPPLSIELGLAVRVEGRTIGPGGAAVAGASVQVFTRDGVPLMPRGHVRSDARGHFALSSLPAEPVWIQASAHDHASIRPLLVSPTASGARSPDELLDVELFPAAWLVVEVEQASATLQACRIRVEDASGLDRAAVEAPGAAERFLTEGWEFSRRRIGPLPAGDYSVRARLADGRTRERAIQTDGREETRLVIEFD